MRRIMFIGALAFIAGGCGKKEEAPKPAAKDPPPAPTPAPTPPSTPPPTPAAPTPTPVAAKKLFLDVHELGAGKVTAKDVAEAHKKDVATQGKHDVEYKAYWVDEKAGKIYCLAEAPSAEAANTVHKEAHGLVAAKIMEVTADNNNWKPSPGMKLFMDVHNVGAGKVTAEAVADAHKKDLAVQDKHKVKYLNYWLDAASGTIMCLSEAPDKEAALKVHKEAHGLMPETIVEVTEGR